jgi:hypothetical protein
MIHTNPANITSDIFRVDRKFDVGMETYAAKIRAPITTVNPDVTGSQAAMDLIDVPLTSAALRGHADQSRSGVATPIPRN